MQLPAVSGKLYRAAQAAKTLARRNLPRGMEVAMIELMEISKSYKGAKVLDSITLTVNGGECVGLAGDNSCGKTTLISIAAGLVKPDGGRVCTTGAAALVPQQPELSPELTVRENLSLWYAAHKLPARDIFSPHSPEHRMGLEEYARTRVKRLSGGRQKRLAIAIALLGNPTTLLLDEPFNMLDIGGSREMTEIVEEQKGLGRAILLTSHEPAELSALCDRVAFMRDGRIADILELSGKSGTEAHSLILQYTRQAY